MTHTEVRHVSTAVRFDAQRFDAKRVRRDQRGFLVVPGHVTRTGIFRYKRSDGSVVRELRHPDDVFDPASMATLEGASITELHPSELVTPENANRLEIGVAGPARQDGSFLASELSVRRASAIGKVESKQLSELSCSYTLDIDPTPGVYEGQRYDQRQTNIRYNHVALGPKGWGRGGPDVRIRMDAECAVRLDSAFTFFDDERRDHMTSSRLDDTGVLCAYLTDEVVHELGMGSATDVHNYAWRLSSRADQDEFVERVKGIYNAKQQAQLAEAETRLQNRWKSTDELARDGALRAATQPSIGSQLAELEARLRRQGER